jgi:hypothetical protein
MVLIFIDQLGTKAKWLSGGKEAASKSFQQFIQMAASSMKSTDPNEIETGAIETDSFVLVVKSIDTALEISKEFYRRAFELTDDGRVWLRGAIIPIEKKDEEELRRQTHLRAPLEKIKLFLYNEDLLEAIQIEKSGFRGMRLVVHKSLVSTETRRKWRIPIETSNFIPFAKLKSSRYPDRIDGNFVDFLWMACPESRDNSTLENLMSLRLRLAAQSTEEFLQAAATQVVFHECKAIMGSISKKIRIGKIIAEKKANQKSKVA